MPTILGANQLDTGYEISNSCQFNTDAYCEFTPSSGSGSTQFTYSAWVKNCGAGGQSETGMILSGAGAGSGADNGIQLGTNAKIQFIEYDGGDNAYYIRTNRLFRDPSAWFHLVLIYDAPDSTAGDRMRLYINGTRETSFSHEVQLPQDRAHAGFTRSGVAIRIGSQASGSNQRFDGYLADVYFCDGQNYEPSEFGETNDNGVWIPKEADVSFGTNGFKLEFKQTGTSANSSGIGADTSGNDNHFSVSGLAAENITTDTPTNNFATLNPLDRHANVVLSEGNLQTVNTSGGGHYPIFTNMAFKNGKWYAEFKRADGNNWKAAIMSIEHDGGSLSVDSTVGNSVSPVNRAGYGLNVDDGNKTHYDGSSFLNQSYGSEIGSILMWAFDADNGKIWWGEDGTWFASGDPAAGSNEAFSSIDTDTLWTLAFHTYNGHNLIANFGNPPFSISSGNSDANGYGNFEFAVPSGFYSICTKNLAEYG